MASRGTCTKSCRQRADATPAEQRQDVVVEVVAVRVKRALAALAGSDHPLEALEPTAGDGVEPGARGERQLTPTSRFRKIAPCCAGGVEVGADRAEADAAGLHDANGVAAVGLAVDAALDPHTLGRRLRRGGRVSCGYRHGPVLASGAREAAHQAVVPPAGT